jgi:hypothetical protein
LRHYKFVCIFSNILIRILTTKAGGGERSVNEIPTAICVIIESSYILHSGQRSCNAARKMERNSLTVTIVIIPNNKWNEKNILIKATTIKLILLICFSPEKGRFTCTWITASEASTDF